MRRGIRIGLVSLAVVVAAVAALVGWLLWQQGKAAGDPAFYEGAIADFEAADAEAFPEPGGIVFVGSSSIRFWGTLAEDMAPLPVIRRGFGGAHMEHVVHNARRIVTPYAPRAVVVYVGTNDLSSGKSVEQVAADFAAFLEIVHADLPDADVWLLSMKPSKLRWSRFESQRALDVELRRLAEADPRVRFVDTGATLLGPDGKPDDVYVFDRLHLNAEGYRRWTALLKPMLMEAYGPGAPGDSACANLDPELAASAFVRVETPRPGARVASPLEVRGCSRTFESNVVFELRGRDGRVLAAGHTTGGGVDGPAAFAFSAAFEVEAPELAHLEVFEDDASDGEGFPPPRSVTPVVVAPAAP